MSPSLPATHRALILNAIGEPLKVETRPTPEATPGSAVVKILTAMILSYSGDIYSGKRPYPLPTPLVPGNGAIGRVAAVGSDATSLSVGDLVLVEIYLRGRDDPTQASLSGVHEGHAERSSRLMRGEWRDSTYAEYAKMPLENCHRLDEGRLLGNITEGGLGYTVEDLLSIGVQIVPFGGLRSIALEPGEKVIVSPATGAFGSAAVQVALAMGASVIAMGRDLGKLRKLQEVCGRDRVQVVQITNDHKQEMDALAQCGPADAFFDVSPPMAAGSSHIRSGMLSLKHSGRIVLMGPGVGEVTVPVAVLMAKNLTIKGKWMFEREDVQRMIQMVEAGILPLGSQAGWVTAGKYKLEQWAEAFASAAQHAGPGERVLFIM
ncbi:hypothetical protein Asppvi_003875 [Aspergillus pseudoviridinutans]|uniref:Alcohol dehydrogenase n=1 Tax=Aspergillus pseudoviridinutans TaxID=1517512 RepID=A0A9P3B950_9EURO|nr:uncharacterized protein Asppvi_003875 [Aspergillus pseudoviridinutans]GIJ85020.1 hypothetical protein Asppvi_003875 [Aspergillus pseudoviridinutans]